MVEHFLKSLSEASGVSGSEHEVRRLITDEIADKCDSVMTDTMGNVIAFKKGKKGGRTIAIEVCMDEAGFIVSGVTDKGYLKFKPVGNTDPRKLVSKRVCVDGRVKGVIGMKAIHLQTADERKNVVKVKDLSIDIGAKDNEEAQKEVKLGSYVTFDTEFKRVGKNIKGKALGRSAACAVLAQALDAECEYDLYACFTAQHEVGARGAQIVSHRVRPDVMLTISAADADDIFYPKGQERAPVMKIGGGCAALYMGTNIITDRELTERMTQAARDEGIALSGCAVLPFKTDGAPSQITGARSLEIAVPCRYVNSPVSVMSVDDIQNAEKYVKLFINKIGDMI